MYIFADFLMPTAVYNIPMYIEYGKTFEYARNYYTVNMQIWFLMAYCYRYQNEKIACQEAWSLLSYVASSRIVKQAKIIARLSSPLRACQGSGSSR